jgi:hypothetical protein
VQSMTLREAALRSTRSVTTLRRYIRSGRLHAHKRPGRFGPEYYVTEQELADAGLPWTTPPPDELRAPVPRSLGSPGHEPVPAQEDNVPSTLFRDLQMKHEQLLVQYGMMRVGGLRAIEMRAELEDARRRLEEAQACAVELRRRLADETARLRQRLRRSELEGESRQIELEALREKLRSVEILNRNASTSESIERQFSEIMAQSRKVRELTDDPPAPPSPKNPLDH